MRALLVAPEQRFSCQQCGRCCRREWDIALTPGEVDAYRKAGVARLFRVDRDQPEGTEQDPWEPTPGCASQLRIRKRADGACGFLSPENRCRIHEQLGSQSKPLSCRLFPFRFHPTGGPPVVTASFCCPTVVANEGALLTTQIQQLRSLAQDWFRAYPEPANEVHLGRRLLTANQVDIVRNVLRDLLERRDDEGRTDLAGSVARMALWLEDLTRFRVSRLDEARFGEYLAIMGRHAASSTKPPPSRRPSPLGRLLFRGFLFTVLAASERVRDRSAGWFRLRVRVLRLLLHTHGLGPAVGAVRLGNARKSRVSLAEPPLLGLVHNYLRSTIGTLGTGHRCVLDELAMAVAFLNAALVMARMSAAARGQGEVDFTTLSQGLMEAVELTHADPGTALGRLLTFFAGGVESLHLFASELRSSEEEERDLVATSQTPRTSSSRPSG